ncbi:coiled-coil domain-containing protein 28B-like [Ornithodoros turicata]|uniref:coiled-coil domain-containing protein 28B-like n=1 Tax=Ornithodoros turicata TaxID=34597 RepID=UPI003139E45F
MLRLKDSSSKVGYLRLAMETPQVQDTNREKTDTTTSSTLAPSSILAGGSEAFPRGESAFELSRQFSAKSPLARVLSESSTEDGKPLRPKMDLRSTPRRAPRNGKAAFAARVEGHAGDPSRPPCEQHSFLTDITDVRQMEQGLLQLLHDFHSGKLQAFGKDCTFEKMENVREQQERLARLHFELNAQQELCGSQSEEGRRLAKENLTKLIENLQHLSQSIEQLQSNSQGMQTDV